MKVKESPMFASKSCRLGDSNDFTLEDEMDLLKVDSRGTPGKNNSRRKSKLLASKRSLTPGPGDYITEKIPRKKVVIPTSRAFIQGGFGQENRFDYDEPKWAVERKVLSANPGPGQYSTNSSLVKKTFNVTYGATTTRVEKSRKGNRNKQNRKEFPLSLQMESHHIIKASTK